jgi:large subunit ribosomal protein L15
MKLNQVGLPNGRKKKKTKRFGRGESSGHGGTSGRGNKGQGARAGGFHKMGFEGGQMPLQRRLPKRGFTNIFAKRYAIVNLDALSALPAGASVDAQFLRDLGLIKSVRDGLKILGRGEIKGAINVKVSAISESARKKIEAAGGKVEVIGG